MSIGTKHALAGGGAVVAAIGVFASTAPPAHAWSAWPIESFDCSGGVRQWGLIIDEDDGGYPPFVDADHNCTSGKTVAIRTKIKYTWGGQTFFEGAVRTPPPYLNVEMHKLWFGAQFTGVCYGIKEQGGVWNIRFIGRGSQGRSQRDCPREIMGDFWQDH